MRVIGLGASGHGKVMIDALRVIGGHEIVGLLDPNRALWGTRILDVPVLGDDDRLQELYSSGVRHAFIGVGSGADTANRRRIYELVTARGFTVVDTVHPRAFVAPSATIGAGATVLAHAVVNAAARVGDNVLVNTSAVVEHDCVIGNHVHLATAARLAGTVTVGDGAHIGIGATVRQGVRIGACAIIGAGAVVLEDVLDRTVVVGVPARPLRSA